ncbi:hypothetical protein QVA66_08930 [Staphylococcus chromogenes]|nr:hypothetical protein [Staphylococcus chromogenes]
MAVGKAALNSIIVGRSACRLWHLPLLRSSGDITVSTAGGRSSTGKRHWPEGVRMQQLQIPPGDVLEWKGVRVTSLERSVIDLCRFEPFADGLVTAEGYLRQGPPNHISRLERKAAEMGRVRGIRQVRKILALADHLSESPAESYAKAVIHEAGLTKTLFQQVAVESSAGIFRLDFLADGWLAIEVDGEVKYALPPDELAEALRRERAREKAILNLGYTLIRASWKQIADGTLLADIRQAYHVRNTRLR